MKPEELPPVYQAELDDDTYAALLRDLSCLDALEVRVQTLPGVLVPEETDWTLDRARAALDAKTVRAIQVRYAHESEIWIDTILRVPQGLRLVRMRAP